MGLVTINPARGIGGMGVYPGTPEQSPCYDPSRPSWLPYWLDTLSEETCRAERFLGRDTRLNFTDGAITLPPSQPAPDTALTDPSSGHLDTDALDALKVAWLEWSPNAIGDEGVKSPSSLVPSLVGIAIVLGLAYWFLNKPKGRRRR